MNNRLDICLYVVYNIRDNIMNYLRQTMPFIMVTITYKTFPVASNNTQLQLPKYRENPRNHLRFNHVPHI